MSLNVLYRNRLVGQLHQKSDSQITFEYSRDWIGAPDSFPVSQSIPLSGRYERGVADHRFFANLLPEAAARETICRGLGISIDNDYALLAATGGECAGALQILPPEIEKPAVNEYEPIRNEDLQKAVETHISYNRLSAGGKLRLSLAGAQDKWPVFLKGERLFWPAGDAPSSHILKFANHSYTGLTNNEAYLSFISRELGLPTVEVTVGNGYSLTVRYDRVGDDSGNILRIHQEDFCQALGYPYYRKYENDGGPSFRECIQLLREISISPAEDMLNLIRWQIFNLLAGNADGHAKNLSILYTKKGPRLAPFYDLVCTAIYPGISRNLALSVGGNADPGQIRKQDWNRLAEELGMRPRLILNTLNTFLDMLQDNLNEYHRQFVEHDKFDPVLDRIDLAVHKQIRRTRTLLKE